MAAATTTSVNASNAIRQRHPVPVINLSRASSSSSLSDESASSTGDDAISTFTPPTFTIKELLGAIPKHCFERSAIRSGAYVVWDLFLIACLVYAATFIDPNVGKHGALLDGTWGVVAKIAAWSLYGYAAGLVGTGVWVISHECGHGAFSASKRINNVVGLILHSALLVPYWSWKISHAQHHAATSSLERDQVFRPHTRSERGLPPLDPGASKREKEGTMSSQYYEKLDDLLEDAPFWALLNILVQQLFGWPAYLIANASGQPRYPKWTNHFNPDAIIFNKRHRQNVIISDIGLLVVAAALGYFGYVCGFGAVAKYYFLPYFWVNHWLVCITYLQHTDPMLPHYREGAFNFQRGALCTIDRNIHNFFFHGIANTHVAHHICSSIPHFNAEEATVALKAKLGDYYMQTDENWMISLWKTYRHCRFVEDEGDVVFFKDAKGRAVRRVVYPTSELSDSGVDVAEDKVVQ